MKKQSFIKLTPESEGEPVQEDRPKRKDPIGDKSDEIRPQRETRKRAADASNKSSKKARIDPEVIACTPLRSTRCHSYKTFISSLTVGLSKLECLSLASLFKLAQRKVSDQSYFQILRHVRENLPLKITLVAFSHRQWHRKKVL
jgi:hypothetical protein